METRTGRAFISGPLERIKECGTSHKIEERRTTRMCGGNEHAKVKSCGITNTFKPILRRCSEMFT
jgi:hypothetical protein